MKASGQLAIIEPDRWLRLWGAACVVSLLATILAARFLDRRIAQHTGHLLNTTTVTHLLSSTVVAACLLLSLCVLAAIAFLSNTLSRAIRPVGLALICALCSLYLGRKLKQLFGWPHFILMGHRFHNPVAIWSQSLFARTFPSTHAATTAGAMTILALCYPRQRGLCFLAIGIVDLLLILGGWHHLSDAMAGTFVGATVALAIFASNRRFLEPAGNQNRI